MNGKKACNAYSKVKGISNAAKWIWHNTLRTNAPRKVLGQGRNHAEFLIFRFPVKRISGGGQSGGGNAQHGPTVDKCDCIPEDLYTVNLTSEQFIPHSWAGNIGNFTCKLGYKPTPHMASFGDAWNSWINAQFGYSRGKACHVIHQYILY